jgi:short-chain fatty acids transporter
MKTMKVENGAQPGTQEGRLDRFARAMSRVVPDTVTTSVLLLVLLFALAIGLGNSFTKTLDAYYEGLWMLLPFTMQMTLIIVLSSVLGATPFFKKAIRLLSRIPNTRSQATAMSVLITALAAYLYWGLGIVLTPLVAIHFAREAERKGIEVDFLFLLALLFAANACWQYGLSATGPLLMATPGHFLERTTGVLPLSTTIWSPAALLQEAGFVAVLIAAGHLLMPKRCRPVSEFPAACKLVEDVQADESAGGSLSERLERVPLVSAILCLFLLGWLYQHLAVKKLGLDITGLCISSLILSRKMPPELGLFHRKS